MRRAGGREQRKRFLIVIGGERTEHDYFKWLKREVGRRAVIELEAKVLDPRQLLKRAQLRATEDRSDARRMGDDGNTYDAVWVITDVDEWASQIADLRRRAEDGVDLIVSNPCFEVWLVLHTDATPSPTRTGVQAQAKDLGLVKGRDGKVPVVEALDGKTAAAADRAERLDERHHRNGSPFPHNVPSSEMYRVVQALPPAS